MQIKEFIERLQKSRVAVIGLGVSNIPLIKYLNKNNVKLVVFDSRELEKIDNDIIKYLRENDVIGNFGKNYLENLVGFDIIFRSPSCLPNLDELIAEKQRGAVVTSEIEMLMKLAPCTVIGVTGSDGKTTTTSLIYEIVKRAGYKCFLGGNIGIPLFDKLEEMKKNDIVVLELSSFQLMDMEVSPNIAVITNITPNHLDLHSSYEEYIDAKKSIFKYQAEKDILVINYNDEIVKNFENEANGAVEFFSKNTKLENGVFIHDNMIKTAENSLRRQLLDIKDIKIRGRHNYENICTAIAATKSLCDFETAVEAVKEFTGVEHRIEFVREIDGVKWYNDSIGSSPTRTIAGLNSFDESIVLIAGGYDKNLDYAPIAKPILDNVSTLVLLGQTANKIKSAVLNEFEKVEGDIIEDKGKIELDYNARKLVIIKVETLEETIIKSKEYAKKGEVILFSPASASFDMFKNFVERGNKFKELVNKL